MDRTLRMLSHCCWPRRKRREGPDKHAGLRYGGNANEIFRSFQLTEAEQEYETVKGRFATHFVGRTNVIFEQARFNQRVQGEQESVINPFH